MTTLDNQELATHPTREALLDAGMRIAARDSVLNMTVDAVVAEAKVAKGTYYIHFTNRVSFLVALYERWHRQLMDKIYAAVTDMSPGADRLRAAGNAYLDACLGTRQLQALLVAARAEIATAEQATNSSTEAATLIATDFAVLGFAHPLAAAQLFVSATIAAALLEHGTRDDAVRESLYHLAMGVPGDGKGR